MTDITILILEGSFPSGVATCLDILAAARQLAPRFATSAPSWRTCSLNGGLVRLGSGMFVETTKLPQKARLRDSLLVIPGLTLQTAGEIAALKDRADVQEAAELVNAHVAAGGRVAAGCSAAFLLQISGVLSGRRATTTWWLAAQLQQLDPACKVDASRTVCADGPVITAGAAFAHADLMLHIVRDLSGPKVAEAVSRTMLLEGRDAQGEYVMPLLLAGGDALVARVVAIAEQSLPDAPKVSSVAKELGMSERTLARHMHRATGKSTVALLQSVKVRAAKTLIERSRNSVETVAAAVGFSDATALRRMMKRATGSNPSSYRPGIGAPQGASTARSSARR
jgi:transcriptional regulator GlxA family with amidase domain